MITNKEITEFIADKVLASQDVKNFCQTNFGKQLLVMIGVDNNNPPSEAELPCLIVEPTVKNIGSNDTMFDYEIALHIGIKGSEKPTVIGNKVTYDGVYTVEELGNLIVELIKTEFATNTNMDTFDVVFYQDAINAFPTYSGVVLASMSVPNLIGMDKITFN